MKQVYASALKFCGAMEVCGLGFPRDLPIDHQWPEVMNQALAQNAGQLICYSRDHKPEEGEFLAAKGFQKVSTFVNPRTGNTAHMWIFMVPKPGECMPRPQPADDFSVSQVGQVITITPNCTYPGDEIIVPF